MKINYCKSSRLVVCVTLIAMQSALVSMRAAGADENPGQFSSADYKFAKAAACGGMLEVTLGKIAAEKSTTASVQQFGQRMVTDHGKANADLQQIASRKGATLPSQPTSDQQKEIDRLNTLSGRDFDKAYVALMVKAHKADEKAFKRASEKVQDADLKAFAANTLTIVQDHLKMAEIEQGVKNNNLTMNQ